MVSQTDTSASLRALSQVSPPSMGSPWAGGLTLAAARDIVLTAASSAKWGLPEVPIGLFPAWGIGSVVRRVGVTSARRLAFGTDTLDGREVHALGLADEVIGGDVLAAASKRAEPLAALPSAQTQAVKRYFATYCADEAADIASNSLFIDLSGSPEARANFRAFRPRTELIIRWRSNCAGCSALQLLGPACAVGARFVARGARANSSHTYDTWST
jgi:hypothetical protein